MNIPFLPRHTLNTPFLAVVIAAWLMVAVPVQAQTVPVFTTQPLARAVLVGSAVTFTGAASGNPAPTYQWKKNGVEINAATGSSYTITGVTTNNGGNYALVATNSAGSATSNIALLSVLLPPSEAVVAFTVGDTISGEYAPSPGNEAAATRFLVQASFGPTAGSIAGLLSSTYSEWIDQQMTLPPTYHLPDFRKRAGEYLAREDNEGYNRPQQQVWWQHALTAPDQLRQRMAFALSEMFVVSLDSSLDGEYEGVTNYYDILVRQAFGNYRQLLEEVTLSPMMGSYLSMIRNQKPNTKTGSQPDENYAREIMQLFSIGLSELNLDGTLRLDANGQPIPTYTQPQIVGLAHVFTGWGPFFDPANPPKWDYSGDTANADDWFFWGRDPLRPMSFYQKYADLKSRTIVGGVTVASTLTGPQRLKLALDTLFNHPNVGPFLGKQLIQRFVTSNPSPAYIQRVAAVFNTNSVGVRGDLGATLRAVLLDPEARKSDGLVDARFGKLTEPLLRLSRLFRAFPPGPPPHAAQGDNRLFLMFQWEMEEQSPLFSPTVFNFFKPGFAQPGAISSASLVSPEFQIFTDTYAIGEANMTYGKIFWGINADEPTNGNYSSEMKLDFAEPLRILSVAGKTVAQRQTDLINYFDARLLGGTMSAFLRQTLQETFTAIPVYNDPPRYNGDVVRTGLYLVIFSPEFNIHR